MADVRALCARARADAASGDGGATSTSGTISVIRVRTSREGETTRDDFLSLILISVPERSTDFERTRAGRNDASRARSMD